MQLKKKMLRTKQMRDFRSQYYIQMRNYLLAMGKYPEHYFKWSFVRAEDEWSIDDLRRQNRNNNSQLMDDKENMLQN